MLQRNWVVAVVALFVAGCGGSNLAASTASVAPQGGSGVADTPQTLATPSPTAAPTATPSPTPVPCTTNIMPAAFCEVAVAAEPVNGDTSGLLQVVLRLPPGTEIRSPIAGTASVYRDAQGAIVAVVVTDNVCAGLDASPAVAIQFRFGSAADAPFPRRTTVPDGRDFGYAEVAANAVIAVVRDTDSLPIFPGFNVLVRGSSSLMEATFPQAFQSPPQTPEPGARVPVSIGPAIFDGGGGTVDYQGHPCTVRR